MIKNDLGHMGCPFYEQKLANGLNVIFIPRKSQLKSALIYVGQGGFSHDEEINSSKIPFGSAYFLEKMIMSEKTKDELKEMAVIGDSTLDYSSTCFTLDTLGDVFKALKVVLDKICSFDFNEMDVEEFKKENASLFFNRSHNPFILTKMTCVENLFSESPIKLGFIPNEEQAKVIHASALKKFQTKYYSASHMTLIISGDFRPGEVIDQVSKLRVPSFTTTYNKKLEYQEDYSQVAHFNRTLHLPYPYDVMSLGIKLPKREKVYEDYGVLSFSMYELLLPLLFTSNNNFLNGLRGINGDLLEAKLLQGDEDAFILLTMKCSDKNRLGIFLTDYLSALEKRYSREDLSRVSNNYYCTALKYLAVPKTAVSNFAAAYSNNIPYTSMVDSISKMKYSTMKEFTSAISTLPKATSLLEHV